jgi:GT2 family glycosyltransferase
MESVNNKKVSVVIPVWHGRKYLPACLAALFEQKDVDLEVIAVDNASTDESANWIAENYPQVRLMRNQSNRGFAGACNIGLRAAEGAIFVLLNQDTQMRQGCLRALLQALDDPQVGVVGCKILYPDGKTIQHAGGGVNWPLGFSYHFGQGEVDTGTWDVPRDVEYVTGAAMAFRRDSIEHIGLLDEGFWPGYFEDVDFCLRARKAGYRVLYMPEAVVVHSESTSIEDSAVVLQLGHRGRLRLILKHTPPERFLDQFVPAEEAIHLGVVHKYQGKGLRMAYLENMLRADSVLRDRWRSDRATVYQVVTALKYLYQQAWDQESRVLTASANLDSAPTFSQVRQLYVPERPLAEATFRSRLPLVDSVIAPLRKFLYRLVAQPAVGYLMQQQQALNQDYANILRVITESHIVQSLCIQTLEQRCWELEQRLLELADENAMLVGESVRLTLGIAHEQATPYRDRDLRPKSLGE